MVFDGACLWKLVGIGATLNPKPRLQTTTQSRMMGIAIGGDDALLKAGTVRGLGFRLC